MRAARPELEALERHLVQVAPFLGARPGRETGIAALDRLLARGGEARGGLPTGALTVLAGAPGSGRASLAARILARETREGRPVAWVDACGTLYPPALLQAGVAFERLLVVRAEAERALYAAERALESGAFRVVAMSGLDRALTPSRARRLQTAAEAETTTGLLLLDPGRAPKLTAAALELRVSRHGRGVRVEVERDRLGPSGRKTFVPFAPEPTPGVIQAA